MTPSLISRNTSHTITKVNKATGALIPLLGNKNNVTRKNKLKTIISPAIIYATPVWGAVILDTAMKKLQGIQKIDVPEWL